MVGVVETTGNFNNFEKWLKKASNPNLDGALAKIGERGVAALRSATPTDTSETANAWSYKIVKSRGKYKIEWHNSHVHSGVPIAILIQHGHGTRTGGYVQGRDFINPAMRGIFDQFAQEVWRVVNDGNR